MGLLFSRHLGWCYAQEVLGPAFSLRGRASILSVVYFGLATVDSRSPVRSVRNPYTNSYAERLEIYGELVSRAGEAAS